MWIKWKCEECWEEFIRKSDVDEPPCPECWCTNTEAIGEVEVTDKQPGIGD